MGTDTFLISLLATVIGGIIVGVITLAIEYGHFQKKDGHSKTQHTASFQTPVTAQSYKKEIEEETFSPSRPYKFILVGFFGAIGGFWAGMLIAAPMEVSWDAAPIVFMPISVVAGILSSLWADDHFSMEKAILWLRLPLAVILGFVGGIAGIIVVIIGLIALIIWILHEGDKSITKNKDNQNQ